MQVSYTMGQAFPPGSEPVTANQGQAGTPPDPSSQPVPDCHTLPHHTQAASASSLQTESVLAQGAGCDEAAQLTATRRQYRHKLLTHPQALTPSVGPEPPMTLEGDRLLRSVEVHGHRAGTHLPILSEEPGSRKHEHCLQSTSAFWHFV